MDKPFEVEFRDDHVRAELGPDFDITPERQTELWAEIEAACSEHDTHRVLIEGLIPKTKLEVPDVVSSGIRTAAAVPRMWLALCFDFFEPTELSDLYKTVAASRGVHVKFFDDRDRALNWLRSNAPA